MPPLSFMASPRLSISFLASIGPSIFCQLKSPTSLFLSSKVTGTSLFFASFAAFNKTSLFKSGFGLAGALATLTSGAFTSTSGASVLTGG